MVAKTRQTWKQDGMNTAEYEIISRKHLPMYTNITVNIGTENGLQQMTPPTKPSRRAALKVPKKVVAKGSVKVEEGRPEPEEKRR